MAVNFDDVAQLQDADVKPGDRVVYAADFNTKRDGENPKSTQRIDAEIADLKLIIGKGGIPVILAHQGRFKDGDAGHLDFVAAYLSRQLGVNVVYHPENHTTEAVDFVANLTPGSVAVMGNTRMHQGEEKNDPLLAERFSKLGKYAAIGGFGKAHRAHASNVGILDFIPGFATRSQLDEMRLLAPWAAEEKGYSVAVLGGVKKEKITIGLEGFARTYDAIIPGGIVLNTIVKVLGYTVGDSILKDGEKSFEAEVKRLLDAHGNKIHVPGQLIVARFEDGKFHDMQTVTTSDGVPDGYKIVDSVLSHGALSALERMVSENGRLVLAGTPSFYPAGFTTATDAVMSRMNRNRERCVVLGGDTAAEVNFTGPVSTGGGSALYFVSNGTTAVFDALKANKRKFSK